MARKSNKTAHVLNLIAGHDANKETKEITVAEELTVETAPSAPADSAHDSTPVTAPSTSGPQNISVIDTTIKDPVADLIQEKLADELQRQAPEMMHEQQPEPEVISAPEPAAASEPVTASQQVTVSQTVAEPEPTVPAQPAAPEPVTEPEPISAAQPVTEPEPAVAAQPATAPEPAVIAQSAAQEPITTPPQTAAAPEPQPEPALQPIPEPEPEPDFVRINVMEHIVKDKIIYYMRQFDVCTCDRCVSDTIALTLSGLLPKYIVTTPAAVDPLLSFYTNKYISDVTVEATKASMTVKDNPRH